MAATRRLQEATDSLVEILSSGDQEAIAAMTQEMRVAEAELDAATLDALSREKTSEGGRRRDKAITLEEEAQREVLFGNLEIDSSATKTPRTKSPKISIEIDPALRLAIEKWSKACNAMGTATVGRWMLTAGVLKAGRPPGWEGEWPPKLDGE
jgi:hypothetical protein